MRWGSHGQSSVEVAIVIPILFTLGISFFQFAYSEFWLQTIEHILHEAIICEQTLGEKLCLQKATYKANRYNLIGTVVIHRTNHRYTADLITFGRLKWKTIQIDHLPEINSNNSKGLL